MDTDTSRYEQLDTDRFLALAIDARQCSKDCHSSRAENPPRFVISKSSGDALRPLPVIVPIIRACG